MDDDSKSVNMPDIAPGRLFQDLIDKLAENTHDVWGYSWKRDGRSKQSSCLVPYKDLPGSEKKYGQSLVEGVISTLIKWGYEISTPGEQASDLIDSDLIEFDLTGFTKKIEKLSINELFKIWKKYDTAVWAEHPELILKLGKRGLKLGEPLFAYDIFSKGIAYFQDMGKNSSLDGKQALIYLGIRQQQALALAQSGALHHAENCLKRLLSDGFQDGETLGIIGRVYKDLYLAEYNPEKKISYLEHSFDIYHNAFIGGIKSNLLEDAYYNGINAATIALLLNQTDQSAQIADTVKNICLEMLDKKASNSFWFSATLGEAFLLLDDVAGAVKYYVKAIHRAGQDYRAISSMKKQVLMITAHKKTVRHIDHIFHVPTVVVFTGIMIDPPGNSSTKFSDELEETVRSQIRQKLDRINAGIGYSCAACGLDIIFLEEMLKRGGEINIFMPFEKEMLIKEHVDQAGAGWKERFENVVKQAATVKTLGYYNPDVNRLNFEFVNIICLGMGQFRSRNLGTDLIVLAARDAESTVHPGGTAYAIRGNISQNLNIEYIHLSQLRGKQNEAENDIDNNKVIETDQAKRHLYLPLMFADVEGYSKLDEAQLISFSLNFLKVISDIIKAYDGNIISKKTQGDGLFIVFDSIETAVALAKALNDTVNQTDWSKYGLPKKMAFRISLDAGPCCSYVESVTNHTEFCGNYVNRAARMEPSTPPGNIYASETFMALSMAHHITTARFEYAGLINLPKNFGIIPAYYVR